MQRACEHALRLSGLGKPNAVCLLQHCPVEAWERECQAATATQRAAKLLAVDSILWGKRPPKDLYGQLQAAVLRQLSYQLMRLLEVCWNPTPGLRSMCLQPNGDQYLIALARCCDGAW